MKQNEQSNRFESTFRIEESPNEVGGGEDEIQRIRVVISIKDRI